MKKFLILVFLFGWFSTRINAQDVHLSQFYTAQLNLNPALGGMYEGEYRIACNYRNQWREINKPIATAMAAFDKKFFFYSDEIDAGILFINDQFSGFNQKTNKIILSGSYKKMLSGHELSGGLQMGMTFRSTDLSLQTFPNQWVYETGEFDPNVNNGENTIGDSQSFFDMNFGLAWSKRFGNIKPTAGFSLFHINRPKDTYFDDKVESLRLRKVFHAEADYRIKPKFSIEPKLLYMWTTKVQDLVFGSNFKYHLGKEPIKNIYAGVLYRAGFGRNRDAAFPVIGMNYKQFDIGLSYDINVSSLSYYSDRKTTFEISVTYTAPLFSPENLSIPCDRY